MSNDEVPVGRLITVIVGVLAASLIVSLGGLVLLGASDGDPEVRETLTHLIETVIGVFIGIVAGRLASGD
ncbi:MAG: hypothetical protein ACSLFM_04140 [Tepidiformaceae bacterium]